MRKTVLLSIAALCLLFLAASASAAKNKETCTTIQSGELLTTDGRTITPGYDLWGYNYQANMFNGTYCDAYRDAAWCQPYKDVELSMKWNNAWLSNKDCDGDGKLDRHHGFDSYIGSGAWLTNHMRDETGTYFVKIVAKPTADYACAQEIWGAFCVTLEVYQGEGAQHFETPGFGIW